MPKLFHAHSPIDSQLSKELCKIFKALAMSPENTIDAMAVRRRKKNP
jgi:hypothetical protein